MSVDGVWELRRTEDERRGPTIKHGVYTKLGNAERPHLPVQESTVHILGVELLRTSVLAAPAHLHQGPLLLGEEVGSLRIVGQGEEGHHGEDHTRQTLDDEDPSPAPHPLDALHVPDAIGEQPADGAGERSADEEVANAEGELMLGVEECEIHREAGEETRLDNSQQETAGNEAAV